MTNRDTYSEMTDRFEAELLDARGFSHLDHIGVACQMLQRYDFLEAAHRYGRALSTIARKAGAQDKFNTTVTLAFLSLLAEKMAETPHKTFDEFMKKNPDLLSRSLLEKWYSAGRMSGLKARTFFLMPDRLET